MNNNERPALYVNPKLALEVTQKLKASCPDEYKAFLQETFGTLTQRDLIFYSLGRLEGLNIAETSFCSRFGFPRDDAQKGQNV
jgi:hypothetical protein